MRVLAVILFALFPLLPHAAEFEIYQSGFQPLDLALQLSADGIDAGERDSFYRVIIRDLESSQSFKAIDPLAFLSTPEESWRAVTYGDWRIIGSDILALCKLQAGENGWRVELQVHDPFREKKLLATQLSEQRAAWRTLAHKTADLIYRAALGIPGYFTSHILYVRKRGRFSDLIHMDQDGFHPQAVGRNFSLLLSPDWSPDGRLVAITTYVDSHPRLEFFDLATGERSVFASFKGLNSTPEFSPDGRYVAATLSYTGNTEIHIYDIKTKTWRRLTHHPAIDTSPTWSPDGKQIAFVSNRSGRPQVYRMPVSGGEAVLVSTVGDYNTSPAWSPAGDRIAMVSKKDWSYAIATIKPDGSDIRYLATGQRVESPSWSPNGQMLLYSAEEDGIRRVYRVPGWGGKSEPITPPNIDASDPAWSRR